MSWMGTCETSPPAEVLSCQKLEADLHMQTAQANVRSLQTESRPVQTVPLSASLSRLERSSISGIQDDRILQQAVDSANLRRVQDDFCQFSSEASPMRYYHRNHPSAEDQFNHLSQTTLEPQVNHFLPQAAAQSSLYQHQNQVLPDASLFRQQNHSVPRPLYRQTHLSVDALPFCQQMQTPEQPPYHHQNQATSEAVTFHQNPQSVDAMLYQHQHQNQLPLETNLYQRPADSSLYHQPSQAATEATMFNQNQQPVEASVFHHQNQQATDASIFHHPNQPTPEGPIYQNLASVEAALYQNQRSVDTSLYHHTNQTTAETPIFHHSSHSSSDAAVYHPQNQPQIDPLYHHQNPSLSGVAQAHYLHQGHAPPSQTPMIYHQNSTSSESSFYRYQNQAAATPFHRQNQSSAPYYHLQNSNAVEGQFHHQQNQPPQESPYHNLLQNQGQVDSRSHNPEVRFYPHQNLSALELCQQSNSAATEAQVFHFQNESAQEAHLRHQIRPAGDLPMYQFQNRIPQVSQGAPIRHQNHSSIDIAMVNYQNQPAQDPQIHPPTCVRGDVQVFQYQNQAPQETQVPHHNVVIAKAPLMHQDNQSSAEGQMHCLSLAMNTGRSQTKIFHQGSEMGVLKFNYQTVSAAEAQTSCMKKVTEEFQAKNFSKTATSVQQGLGGQLEGSGQHFASSTLQWNVSHVCHDIVPAHDHREQHQTRVTGVKSHQVATHTSESSTVAQGESSQHDLKLNKEKGGVRNLKTSEPDSHIQGTVGIAIEVSPEENSSSKSKAFFYLPSEAESQHSEGSLSESECQVNHEQVARKPLVSTESFVVLDHDVSAQNTSTDNNLFSECCNEETGLSNEGLSRGEAVASAAKSESNSSQIAETGKEMNEKEAKGSGCFAVSSENLVCHVEENSNTAEPCGSVGNQNSIEAVIPPQYEDADQLQPHVYPIDMSDEDFDDNSKADKSHHFDTSDPRNTLSLDSTEPSVEHFAEAMADEAHNEFVDELNQLQINDLSGNESDIIEDTASASNAHLLPRPPDILATLPINAESDDDDFTPLAACQSVSPSHPQGQHCQEVLHQPSAPCVLVDERLMVYQQPFMQPPQNVNRSVSVASLHCDSPSPQPSCNGSDDSCTVFGCLFVDSEEVDFPFPSTFSPLSSSPLASPPLLTPPCVTPPLVLSAIDTFNIIPTPSILLTSSTPSTPQSSTPPFSSPLSSSPASPSNTRSARDFVCNPSQNTEDITQDHPRPVFSSSVTEQSSELSEDQNPSGECQRRFIKEIQSTEDKNFQASSETVLLHRPEGPLVDSFAAVPFEEIPSPQYPEKIDAEQFKLQAELCEASLGSQQGLLKEKEMMPVSSGQCESKHMKSDQLQRASKLSDPGATSPAAEVKCRTSSTNVESLQFLPSSVQYSGLSPCPSLEASLEPPSPSASVPTSTATKKSILESQLQDQSQNFILQTGHTSFSLPQTTEWSQLQCPIQIQPVSTVESTPQSTVPLQQEQRSSSLPINNIAQSILNGQSLSSSIPQAQHQPLIQFMPGQSQNAIQAPLLSMTRPQHLIQSGVQVGLQTQLQSQHFMQVQCQTMVTAPPQSILQSQTQGLENELAQPQSTTIQSSSRPVQVPPQQMIQGQAQSYLQAQTVIQGQSQPISQELPQVNAQTIIQDQSLLPIQNMERQQCLGHSTLVDSCVNQEPHVPLSKAEEHLTDICSTDASSDMVQTVAPEELLQHSDRKYETSHSCVPQAAMLEPTTQCDQLSSAELGSSPEDGSMIPLDYAAPQSDADLSETYSVPGQDLSDDMSLASVPPRPTNQQQGPTAIRVNGLHTPTPCRLKL